LGVAGRGRERVGWCGVGGIGGFGQALRESMGGGSGFARCVGGAACRVRCGAKVVDLKLAPGESRRLETELKEQ
jgi:hypothetical protein